MSEESINAIIQEIDKLNALPNIEEINFNTGYRKAIYDSCYLYENLIKENERLHTIIKEVREIVEEKAKEEIGGLSNKLLEILNKEKE